jgi:hypothetical protein
MLIEKQITAQRSTTDPVVIYSPNPDEMIIKELNNVYAGRCKDGCFIISVLRIVAKSPFIMDHERTGGTCLYSVCFIVQAEQYIPNEVISSAQLKEILGDGLMLFSLPNASAYIQSHPIMSHIKIGDVIPLRVKEAAYSPRKKMICIVAIPFVPEQDDTQWDVTITADDIPHLQKIVAPPLVETKATEVLYPYIELAKPPKPFRIINISDLQPGRWLISKWLPDPWACLAQEIKTESKVSSISPKDLFRGWAEHARAHSRLINELSATYKFDKTDKRIWDIYTTSRLPPPVAIVLPASP